VEPKENLTGCEELLRRFEDEWSAKEASATNRRSSSEETVMLRKGKLRLNLRYVNQHSDKLPNFIAGPSSSDKSQKSEKSKLDKEKDKTEHSATPVRTTPREEKIEKPSRSTAASVRKRIMTRTMR